MADQSTDPKAQGQGQTVGTEDNKENQVAFGGSEDFFDDPNFLSKIGQGNTNPVLETDNEEVNLGDISNIFEKEKADKMAEKIENSDLYTTPVVEEEKIEVEPVVEETMEKKNIEETPAVEQVQIVKTPKIEPEVIIEKPIVPEVPVIAEAVEENNEDDDDEIEDEDEIIEEEKIEETTEPNIEITSEDESDFVKKFDELKNIMVKVYEAKAKLGYEGRDFDVIGANSDINKITYGFDLAEDGTISIKKIELDKKTEEESEHVLLFSIEDGGLNVGMDDMVIFEEKKDLQNDQKKKIQVMDKINKFIFLAEEYKKTIQKELDEKLEEEQERKKMQDIFRNF